MALIEITLTIDGQAGPFDLFSNVDNYVAAFDTQVPAASLAAGYIVVAPAGTSTVKVCSTGVCTNCVSIPTNCPTTTTTTSSSTSTTTSTSTSTSTTTTEVPPNQFNWELITNTPGSLTAAFPQKSILSITVNTIEVVSVAITGSASSASGVLDILPGDVVAATVLTQREGLYNFVHTIIKDGVLYQAQDTCNECTDDYTTALSPNFVGAGVDVDFSFVADTYKEEVTTTTTTTVTPTTTTTTSSSSSTTTTTTTCDCSLNGATAVITSGTTTTKFPVTTTTTTTSGVQLQAALRSTLSETNLAIAICDFSLSAFTFKSGSLTPTIGDTLYNIAGTPSTPGQSTFNGQNKYWHYFSSLQPSGAVSYIIRVGTGGIISYVETCFA
tara:strand:+ start:610 stop:1761 length:1152 start_codon:yes stop_codon:yes gene_type:complete